MEGEKNTSFSTKATIAVAIIGLLTAIVEIVPKVLENKKNDTAEVQSTIVKKEDMNPLNDLSLNNYTSSDKTYVQPDISGTWYLNNRSDITDMYYNFIQNGNIISFTIIKSGIETGKGNGTINNNTIEFVIMDQQSKWTGTFLLSMDGKSITGGAYNDAKVYSPLSLSR
jgi:hypothetical protein